MLFEASHLVNIMLHKCLCRCQFQTQSGPELSFKRDSVLSSWAFVLQNTSHTEKKNTERLELSTMFTEHPWKV